MEFLENRLLPGTPDRIKIGSLTKENQVSLVRTFLSEPDSGSKIGRLGGCRAHANGVVL